MRRISSISIIAAACAVAAPALATVASFPASAATSTAKVTVTYQGTRGYAHRITTTTSASASRVTASRAAGIRLASGVTGPDLGPMLPDSPAGPGAQPAVAPRPEAAPVSGVVTAPARPLTGQARVVTSFNGLSDADTARVFGRAVTPPDQGLCAGHDPTLAGDPAVIWEAVNNAARETAPDGTLLRPDQSLRTLFRDPFGDGDVRCIWDPVTQSFLFSELGFPVATGPNASDTNTTVDIAVLNPLGIATYQFDTSLGGQCLGDQPKLGFNINAAIVSTDEFCGPLLNNFEGAIALVISLPQLITEAVTVNDAVLGPVSLPGNIVIAMDPVYGPGLPNAYLVNSFPFNGQGSRNVTADTLGFWTIRNTITVTHGFGTPSITGTIIPSETYGFPVRATSTGTGTVVNVVNGRPITSEAFLNPNDSRINCQLEAVHTFGGVQIYAVLDTALTPAGDTTVRDGAAWFQIDALRQAVTDQGYVAASGAYLIHPVIAKTRRGSPTLAFAVTSSTINPSAAFTTVDAGTITIVAAGAGPHLSFSDAPPFNRPRWGDYSAASVLPDDSGIWMATEYIPPAADQNPSDNWGTSVFLISG